jgi:hypothetical protein
MGSIIQNAANNIGANGVFSSSALTNASVSGISALPSGARGKPILLSTQTASASASISFTTGIDSTYDIYKFEIINCHPSTDGVKLEFNLSTDGGSSYNVTKTTTVFDAYHREDTSSVGLGYNSSQDLAQSTAFQNLTPEVELGNANDASVSGLFQLFNPASTTYVKHFIYNGNHMSYLSPPWSINAHVAGYGNTTSAVNAIQFKMSSGNIDAGTIKMYGISA